MLLYLGSEESILARDLWKKERERMEKLGLFDQTSPNFVTNPSGVDPEDAQPAEEDYIRVPFRLLTETIVAAETRRATDFSANEGVLRESMSKLEGKVVYVEHEDFVGNDQGVIESVEWEERTTVNGISVPPGITGILKIDAKSNPKVARSLLSDPPSIQSASVTIDFKWSPSHNFEDPLDFEINIGNISPEDNAMITRQVTEIKEYHSVSLVHMGADPFAKIKDSEGNFINVDSSRVRDENFSTKERKAYDKDQTYFASFSFKQDVGKSYTELKGQRGQKNNDPNPVTMNEQLAQLLLSVTGAEKIEDLSMDHVKSMFGVTKDGDLTKEDIENLRILGKDDKTDEEQRLQEELDTKTNRVNELKKEKDELEKAKPELDKFRPVVEELKKNLELEDDKLDADTVSETLKDLRKRAESYDQNLEDLRGRVKHLCQLANGGENKEMEGIIDRATESELRAFAKQYGYSSIEGFSAQCEECGSSKVTMRSSKPGDDTKGPSENERTEDSILEQKRKSRFNIHRSAQEKEEQKN